MSMLSPTSINTYLSCPRSYYLKYIKRLRQPISKYMLRGTLVHSVIEDMFNLRSPNGLHKFVESEVDRRWSMKNVPDMKPEDEDGFKNETKQILKSFVKLLESRMETLMCEGGVCNGKFHAWNTIKPKKQEEHIKLPMLGLQGKLDAIHIESDWGSDEKKTFIIDYKTSKLWHYNVPDDYILQGKIYDLLYKEKHGVKSTFVGFNYLRYGEIMNFFFTEQDLEDTKALVQDIRKKTLSNNFEDYPCTCDGKTDMCKLYTVDEKGEVQKVKTKEEQEKEKETEKTKKSDNNDSDNGNSS